MKKNIPYIGGCLGLFLIFSLSVWFVSTWLSTPKEKITESGSVLLEKINTVTKLISVEGVFSEIYQHENEYEPLKHPLIPDILSPTFRKKVLIIVKAKVSVGYDMEKMKIDIDHTNKKVIISDIPDPEIISIDHDLEYFDLVQSTFNKFDKDEFTMMSRGAKEFIREQAKKSNLLEKAEEQGNKMIELITFMVKEAGYEVDYKYKNELPDLLN